MAITYTYKGRRIGETYIKCNPVGITSESDYVLKYFYKPVCGDGEIILDRTDMLDDNVVPMEHIRLRERIGILEELKYPVDDICRVVGAPEYLVKQYLYEGYVGLDHDGLRNERHKLYARCAELREQNTRLMEALDSKKADNIPFEHRGKELTEKNAKLNEALESAMADIRYLENSRKEMVEKNGNLAKQLSDLQEKADTLSSEYIRVCKARDEHIKHINALEHQIEDLEHEKKVTADMYDLANKTLCEVRAENAKLQERIDAYAIITRSHIDTSSMKHEAYELGKWICTSVAALHQDGKTVCEIADVLDMPESFVERVLKDF